MIKPSLLIIAFIFITNIATAQISGNWGVQGDNTFFNPILPSDYSDIDAIKVDSNFYAISSTFQFSPGMVVLHSKDLVNWQIIGHAVNDLTQISAELNWDKMNRYGRGVWAGSIRYYNGRFWVYFGTPDEGFFMSSAKTPSGPWEPLHHVWAVTGWDDCCSFMDDDGQIYFIATQFNLDPKNNKKYNIHLFKMSKDGKHLIQKSDTIIYQSKGSEANKLYKINGTYYHYFSEVTSEGRVPMMGRSKNIYGPYTYKQLIHVNKKDDREPNQGGLIQLETGKWWFLTHHGTSGHWEGRQASLLPVTWIEGWPIIGRVGADSIGNMMWKSTSPFKSQKQSFPLISDEFNTQSLAVQWEWNYQPRSDKWSLSEKQDALRLHAFKPIDPDNKKNILFRVGNIITQRSIKTDTCHVTIKVDISKMANGQLSGLCHFGSTYSTFGIEQRDGIRRICYDKNGHKSLGEIINSPTIYLKSSWGYSGYSIYSYSTDGLNYNLFGETYKLTWGKYRGDRIGVFTYNTLKENGYIDVDYFHYNYIK